MTFGRTLEANARRLSPLQRSALVKLGLGALPWINRAFGRRDASPSTWVTFMTARALAREGLATISVSGCGSWLRLTACGRTYARVLAERDTAEAEDAQAAADGALPVRRVPDWIKVKNPDGPGDDPGARGNVVALDRHHEQI